MSDGDFFGDIGDADDFAMPGDEQLLADMQEQTEPVAEEPAERVRDEQGRFAKAESADEAPAAEPAAEPEAAPEPELILGKFKTPEDLAKSTDELARHYEDLQRELGALRNELGEARREAREQVQQPVTPHTPVTQDMIDNNPGMAAQLAWGQGNVDVARVALEAWKLDDPFAAALWVGELRQQERDQQHQQELAQIREQVAPLEKQTRDSDLKAGVAGLTQKYPEIGEFMMSDEFTALAQQIPLAWKGLTEGTADEQVSAIETIFLIHRGRATDNLTETSREVTRAAAEEAERVREEAFVASATATAGAPKPSRAEQLAEGWDDDPIGAGWNV